jgi:hypothetical protein
MTTRIVWKHFAQLGPFRWDQIAPTAAARAAFGVVVPLALGLGERSCPLRRLCGFGSVFRRHRLVSGRVANPRRGRGAGQHRHGAVGVHRRDHGRHLGMASRADRSDLGIFHRASDRSWPAVEPRGSPMVDCPAIAVGLPFEPATAGARALLVFAGGLFQAVLIVAS